MPRNPGDLDPEFSIINIPGGSVRGIVEDDQGAFVYVVWVSGECWLYRAFSDGSPDLQFGVNGVAKWAFAPGMESIPVQLIRQADGKFLLIGAVRTEFAKPRTAITRFNNRGSPDLIFGTKIFPFPTEGNFVTDFPSGYLQADGKILVAAAYAMLDDGSTVYKAAVLHRLHANGETDFGFGGGRGFIEVRFNGQDSKVESVAVLKDGSILVGGTLERTRDGIVAPKMSIARFFPNGTLDQAFGVFGYWEAEGTNGMGQMIVHEDSIICVGYEGIGNGLYAAISRLTSDGVLDPAFNNGKALLIDIPADIPRFFVYFDSVVVQSDGNIVGAGRAGNETTAFWLRVQGNGVLDFTFGNQGVVNYHQPSVLRGLIVQNGGQRIIAALDPRMTSSPQIVGIES